MEYTLDGRFPFRADEARAYDVSYTLEVSGKTHHPEPLRIQADSPAAAVLELRARCRGVVRVTGVRSRDGECPPEEWACN